VRLGGRDYGPYEGMDGHSIAFSSDGTVFVFSYTAGGKAFFQTDSRLYGGYDGIKAYPDFGQYGNALNFGFEDGGSCFFLIRDQQFGPYERLWGEPVFSRDGRHFSFIYKKGGRFFVHVCGKDYGGFDRVDGLCISVDGARHSFAFWNGGSMYIQLDGSTYGPYDFAAVDTLLQNTFSPGGESFCFYYTKDNRHYIRYNDAVYGPFEYALNPRMSPDGKSVAVIHNVGGKEGYEKITGGRWYVQVNDRVYDCGEEVAFRYGPGGRTAVMAYRSDGTIYIRELEL
jgi:hypothetical protein